MRAATATTPALTRASAHAPRHGQARKACSRRGSVAARAFMPRADKQPMPLSAEEHFSTLLTTMPGLNTKHWAGRVGEFVTSAGSEVISSGAILHLWKARGGLEQQQEHQGQQPDGPQPEVQAPAAAAEVAIRYFTAEGVSDTVSVPHAPAPGDSASASGGTSSSPQQAGLSEDAAAFVWDQAALNAKPTAFVFSPSSPQLSLVLPGPSAGNQQQQQQPLLHRLLRLLPLSSSGVCVLNAALPPGFAATGSNPPGSYGWFFEVLLTHPDESGTWQGSTLGVSYGADDGRLSSHRYSWQKATSPLSDPPEDLSRVVLQPVTPPSRRTDTKLSELLTALTSTTQLARSATVYSFAPSGSITSGGGAAPGGQAGADPTNDRASSSSQLRSGSSGTAGERRLMRHHTEGVVPSSSVAAVLGAMCSLTERGDAGSGDAWHSNNSSSSSGSGSVLHGWLTSSSGPLVDLADLGCTATRAAAAGSTADASSGGSCCGSGQRATATGAGSSRTPEREEEKEEEEAREWDARQVVLWFPQGGCWARVPAQLPGASVGEGVVEAEVGVVHGNGTGASRCVLRYSLQGDRRIEAVVNEDWRQERCG